MDVNKAIILKNYLLPIKKNEDEDIISAVIIILYVFYCSRKFKGASCGVSGRYDGTVDGISSLLNPVTVESISFTGFTVSVQVDENAAGNYNFGIDISSLTDQPAGVVILTVEGTLSGTTMTIDKQTYDYRGVAEFTLNGVVEFSAGFGCRLSGTLYLTGADDGNLTFQCAKE